MNFSEINHYLRQVFQGHFRLSRRVSSPMVSIEGEASFSCCDKDVTLFQEKGEYLLNGKRQSFYQERFFVLKSDCLLIQKQDKSPLHTFFYQDMAQEMRDAFFHTHVCGQDIYNVTIKIFSEQTFSMDYNVESPTDPYVVTSLYKKEN
ncbi:MAG: hypothetical protein H6925_01750 [Holosporaceae bacterium]|nr:MAG: hypothetical protein H6925_01750 [Holosporaceae bacterium]